MILNSIIQIILAILLVLLLLFIGNMIYNYESIINFRNSYSIKKEIIIFDGIMDMSQESNWEYDTYDINSASYRDLTPSINQNGGAEYSYNFWMFMGQDRMQSEITADDLVILLRGNKKMIPYSNDKNCILQEKGKYILVKNPLIRVRGNGDSIIVEYNTVTSPDVFRENGKSAIDCQSGNWNDKNKGHLGIYELRHNTTKTYNKKWFMFTLVLREITPENDILYKNKTSCKIYINGINVLDRVVESPYDSSYGSAAMRHNRGSLYVNPGNVLDTSENPFKTSNTACALANLTYYNYALNEADVIRYYQKGFTKKPAVRVFSSKESEEDKFAKAYVSQDKNNLPKPF